ncbi:MAG: hypothetical protein PF542_03450 [Nanoarchaeota archaeon]|jgi:uracil-DNA glycosylase family 4|nr:hypothetical protein [Nanoarchaeota archaeon]
MKLDKSSCNLCGLHENQEPVLSEIEESDIMWVGISSQQNKKELVFNPLDGRTNSGKFVNLIESKLPKVSFYKTNLVKCLPLDSKGKIRYPTTKEYTLCFNHLSEEISTVNPKIIILLGNSVSKFVCEKFNINGEKYLPIRYKDKIIVTIDHPSYIMIYKRKKIDEYIDTIIEIIKNI